MFSESRLWECLIFQCLMSHFIVQKCTHVTKVSCFSVHFCSRPSQITWFACNFVYICVILCVGGAWGVWQFLWRVDVCMQIYCVFWEPFMGMSCFTMISDSCLWECRVFTLFPYRQVRFDCIFTRFADNRLWEYRIFSVKKACLTQTSRVFYGFSICSCSLRLYKALWGFGR